MIISNLSHAKAIPFNIGESERFRKAITLPRTVGLEYCPSNRNMIGGNLLYLIWKSYQTKTTKDLLAEEDVFDHVFLRDLVVIKKRPLIYIIVSSFKVPVAVLGVKYFSKHLAQGENKDATFIL